MIGVGFIWTFAMVVLSLMLMTLIAYAYPDSTVGKTFAIIK